MDDYVFFLVWADCGGTPTRKHNDRAAAEKEAERLARLHGGTFHVMACVGSCRRVDVEWIRRDEIPF